MANKKFSKQLKTGHRNSQSALLILTEANETLVIFTSIGKKLKL